MFILLHGINAPVVNNDLTITPTVMRGWENNGDTTFNHLYIFAVTLMLLSSQLAKLYTYMLRNSVGPVVCDRGQNEG